MYKIYGNHNAGDQDRITRLLTRKGLAYELCSVELEANMIYLYERGHMSIPQIFHSEDPVANGINDIHVGSSVDDLLAFLEV